MNDRAKMGRYRYAAIIVLIFLTGCAMPLSNRIGVLGTTGPNVSLNGKNAPNGALIVEGDVITTGANSSALIDFYDGGFFQLDQNTDPIFLRKRLQSGVCILVRMFSGQAFVDKPAFCLETPDLIATNNSQVNIKVSGQQSILTLVEGHVNIDWPRPMPVREAQQVTVTKRGEMTMRELPAPALLEATRWREKYVFKGWCCINNRVAEGERGLCKSQAFSFNGDLLETRCRSPELLIPPPIRSRQPEYREPAKKPPSVTDRQYR